MNCKHSIFNYEHSQSSWDEISCTLNISYTIQPLLKPAPVKTDNSSFLMNMIASII